MATRFPDCVKQLMSNSKEDFLKAANLLLRIARNIENNPGVEKYQSIQIGSKTFMDSLLPFEGGVQCLLEMGFEESGERFKYQIDLVDKLKNMRSILEEAIKEQPSIGTQQHVRKSDNMSTSVATRDSENQVYSRLVSNFEHVMKYENAAIQRKARSVIPLDVLSTRAKEKRSENLQFRGRNGMVLLGYDDCIILVLLEWFKHDFFKWVDSPPCNTCPQSKCIMVRMLTPTDEELRWDGHRVEGHQCNNCGAMVRFPRYNNPEKLLETRMGRCGEWADCFTLLCRSLGYESRHVVDWTDHVWTEVYSNAAERWIHCDPCENAFDKPLLYERGWGKKLSLLIAASCDEIVDVSWRYTEKPNDLLHRRSTLFRESWLENVLKKMNGRRQQAFSQDRKRKIENRMVREMLEFVTPKNGSTAVYGGRTTGSVEWRSARGEMGAELPIKTNRVLCPTTYKRSGDAKFFMEYFSQSNNYNCNLDIDASGWNSLTYSHSSIKRKVELDWKMAYLARTESSDKGHVCWKFDLKKLDRKVIVKEVSVKAESTVFHSGEVKWLLCTDAKSFPLKNGFSSFNDDVYGARTVSIYAFLTGGDGDNAWQHTQLFRTSTETSNDDSQFKVTIKYGSS